MTRGEDVGQRRNALGWNQAELAAAAKVNKGTIVRIERDDESVKPRTFRKVAEALVKAERDLLGLGVQALSLPTQGASAYADPSRVLQVDRAVISELKALATRILVIAGSLDDAAERGRGADPQSHHLHSTATPKKR